MEDQVTWYSRDGGRSDSGGAYDSTGVAGLAVVALLLASAWRRTGR